MPERVIDIDYEDFCRNPQGHVLAVWERVRSACPPALELAKPRLDGLKPMSNADVVTLDAAQFQRLRDLVEVSRSLGHRA